MMYQIPLHTLCTMRFGLNIRTGNTGDIPCLQGKDFNEYGHLKPDFIYKINRYLAKPKDYLKKNDVLFAAKGYHNYAVVWDCQFNDAVATSTFIILNGFQNHVLPGYIAWYLNSTRGQAYFNMHKKNGSVPVISKKILENLTITIPDLQTQQHIVSLYRCHVREKKIVRQMMVKKEQFLDATINQFFSNKDV